MKRLLSAAALLIPLTQLPAAEPQLAHMVFFTLAEDTTENRETLVAACQKYLSDHEGTVYFSAGSINEELDRDVNDREFDVALHVVFESRKTHDLYQTHPRHLKFIEENKHLWSSVRVFDSDVASPRHDNIPPGGKGFAGMLRGVVSSKQYGQIVLEVTGVERSWSHSGAENANSLIGRELLVEGRQKPANIPAFIRQLRTGETITLDVANQQGNVLTILELTDGQRERLGQ